MAITKSIPTVIKSIQRGVIQIDNAASTDTATISSVDTTRSMISFLGYQTNDTLATNTRGSFTLTNATTVTFTRMGAANSIIGSYEVIEYA